MEILGTEGWARVSGDGARFESSFPCEVDCDETFEQLVDKTHRQFLDLVQGKQTRFSTSLIDTRGYLLATNGMLLSSGGIHPISESHVRKYNHGEENGYEVTGLYEAVTASFQTGKLFSELDLPWAVKTAPISVENLETLCLEKPSAPPNREELQKHSAPSSPMY
jgi:hypothetical protein